LISDIADASRLDAELSRGETRPVNLGKMLATLADIHSATQGENSPNLTIATLVDAKEELIVSGMEDRLVQVLRNLISNAVSFSPSLRDKPDASIRITAERQGQWVVLTVDDDGPGIPAGKEQTIFNRFYTERPEAEAFGRHSGLGLSISKQIVEAHGGTLTAQTLKNPDGSAKGARFTIRLQAA
jgi:two-component system sensor histidine kinase ChvG